MGQLLASTSLSGDSLRVLLCLIRNSSTAAKCKDFPFHCSGLLCIHPLVRVLEFLCRLTSLQPRIKKPVGWLGCFLANDIVCSPMNHQAPLTAPECNYKPTAVHGVCTNVESTEPAAAAMPEPSKGQNGQSQAQAAPTCCCCCC